MIRPTGTHLLADLHGCAHLDDPALIETALRAAVTAAGATLIDLRLHHFGPAQGVTGVALLAESHISIHTWPEHGYAAIDIFLCGDAHDIDSALGVIVKAVSARNVAKQRITRGMASVAPKNVKDRGCPTQIEPHRDAELVSTSTLPPGRYSRLGGASRRKVKGLAERSE